MQTQPAVPAFDDHNPPARELLDDCVHCGFCLPACPTYALWGQEADSPRGRILLMDLAAREQLPLTPDLATHWDRCLGCMACVPACPSGVRYDRLIEQTRQQVERRLPRPLPDRLRRAALFALLPHPRRMRAAGALLLAWRATGLRSLTQRLGRATLLPAVPAAAVTARLPAFLPAADPPARQRVVLLTGCVQHGLFGDVNLATARVLAAYGCDVVIPPRQGCCGALELHAGREDAAVARARALLPTVDADRDALVAVNSAGCGSVLKDYAALLSPDPRAARFAERVRDVSEILSCLSPPPGALHPLPLRVAYHDACHLAHAQGIRTEPRTLLSSIPSLDLVPLPESDMCCGSAGVYNLLQPGPARELGRRKAAHVRTASPDVLAAANPGCLVQVSAHLGRDGVPTYHPVELLDASLRAIPAPTLLAQRRRLQGLRR